MREINSKTARLDFSPVALARIPELMHVSFQASGASVNWYNSCRGQHRSYQKDKVNVTWDSSFKTLSYRCVFTYEVWHVPYIMVYSCKRLEICQCYVKLWCIHAVEHCAVCKNWSWKIVSHATPVSEGPRQWGPGFLMSWEACVLIVETHCFQALGQQPPALCGHSLRFPLPLIVILV